MSTGRIENGLAAARARLGWSQSRTAAAAGVSRQSYAAIEAGAAVPSTEVALRLARAFEQPVEALFRLADAPAERVRARWAGGRAPLGQRVRLAQVGGRSVAYPTGEFEQPIRSADGVVLGEEGGEVEVVLLADRPPEATLVVVGCDPSFGVVADALRRERGVEVGWFARGSRAALKSLADGEAHVAGTHLKNAATGEYNATFVRELVPFACTRISFATWEQGLLVGPGNPAGIERVEDLARPGIRLLNREPGSGSRALLDERLGEAGVTADGIAGYGTRARGHLAVAEGIAAGVADAGVGIRAAGAAFGLDVVPLATERYELIVPDHFLDLPQVGALLDTLRQRGIRAQIESLQGYDAGDMGLPA